ncbi:MAG: aspartate/glutamate racemase family protein [Chloroflexi bacterium]|nr:aspartate/glutamate racemase family protein [Chloroflexota bacterium]
MRIVVIMPVVTRDLGPSVIRELSAVAKADDNVQVTFIDNGPPSIECEFDEALAVPDMINKAIEAEREGADAIIINCMQDPGLKACREAVSIPVVAPLETASHFAASLGRKFSVITTLSGSVPPIRDRCLMYGFRHSLASVRAVGIPVLELEKDMSTVISALVKQGQRAIEEDGADVIVFGCTCMVGAAQAVEEGLRKKGYAVPVVDPSVLAVRVAEVLADIGLSHSKRAYPYPPRKVITGYEGFRTS